MVKIKKVSDKTLCYIHFYKNEYKYYNVNIKSFTLSKLINLLLSIIRDIIKTKKEK